MSTHKLLCKLYLCWVEIAVYDVLKEDQKLYMNSLMFRGHNKTFHAFFVAESNVAESIFLITKYRNIPVCIKYFIGGKDHFYYNLYYPLQNNTKHAIF